MNFDNIVITDILNVVTIFSPKGRIEKMNNRMCSGLSFTEEGQITYMHNGKPFVSDRSHAVILPKGQSYIIYGNKDGKFPVINFECENLFSDTITVLPVENIETVMRNFEQMKKLFILKSNRLAVMSMLYNIFDIFLRSGNFTSNPLAPAMKYAENNYCGNVTNALLSKQCNLSEEYFRKLFKKTYGMSPKQYILNMRINKAKQMLSEGVLKINAVSEECGFTNPYHFCRFFKQKTGLTPSEFMNRNKIYKI